MTENRLYVEGPAAAAKAPILITQFEGALDAGSSGALAVSQLLRNLNAQRVATFDTDRLVDYRSHRPTMEVDNWVTVGMTQPEIALDLVHDDAGTPILILHGPEPDLQWNAFAGDVQALTKAAGVEVVFAFHGLPAAVPHSRPTSVHLQSTDPDLIPDQPMMGGGVARFPAPLSSFIQQVMHDDGLATVTLLAAVPYYMAESTFPRAASALLRRLSDLAELSLPVGDLERGADADASQVAKIVEVNPELQRTVTALEQHYDSISQAAAEGAQLDAQRDEDAADEAAGAFGSLPSWDILAETVGEKDGASIPEAEHVDGDDSDSMADLIGDAIESYLRTRGKRKAGPDVRLPGNQKSPALETPEQPAGRHEPKHRAPAPWESKGGATLHPLAGSDTHEGTDEDDGSDEDSEDA